MPLKKIFFVFYFTIKVYFTLILYLFIYLLKLFINKVGLDRQLLADPISLDEVHRSSLIQGDTSVHQQMLCSPYLRSLLLSMLIISSTQVIIAQLTQRKASALKQVIPSTLVWFI